MAQATDAVDEKISQQDQNDQVTESQSVELSEVSNVNQTGSASSIDILLEMDVPVAVTIGRSEMTIQQILQLGCGSVIKLDKSVDAPADIYLKDIKFATGNIVVVDGKFAVRIKEICSRAENDGIETNGSK